MEYNSKVIIVIINYNGNEDTIQCIQSIDTYCKRHNYTILLVENGSKSPLVESDLSSFDIPIILESSTNNLGFAGGNNLVLNRVKISEYDYVFLLNNDTVLIDDSIDQLITALNKHPNTIGGLVNYYYDSPMEVWQAGSYVRATKISGTEKRYVKDNISRLEYVDTIPGSSMAIPTKVIKDIGLFDARYFAYYEEVDFCIRAQKYGYHVAFLTNTKILHKVGRSSSSKLKHYLRSRNTLLLYKKHYGRLMCIAYLRIIMRTARDYINTCFKINYLSPMMKGIKDFKNNIFGAGSINKFK